MQCGLVCKKYRGIKFAFDMNVHMVGLPVEGFIAIFDYGSRWERLGKSENGTVLADENAVTHLTLRREYFLFQRMESPALSVIVSKSRSERSRSRAKNFGTSRLRGLKAARTPSLRPETLCIHTLRSEGPNLQSTSTNAFTTVSEACFHYDEYRGKFCTTWSSPSQKAKPQDSSVMYIALPRVTCNQDIWRSEGNQTNQAKSMALDPTPFYRFAMDQKTQTGRSAGLFSSRPSGHLKKKLSG